MSDDNEEMRGPRRQPVDVAGGANGWFSWSRNTSYPGGRRTAFTEHRYDPYRDETDDDYDPWAGH